MNQKRVWHSKTIWLQMIVSAIVSIDPSLIDYVCSNKKPMILGLCIATIASRCIGSDISFKKKKKEVNLIRLK